MADDKRSAKNRVVGVGHLALGLVGAGLFFWGGRTHDLTVVRIRVPYGFQILAGFCLLWALVGLLGALGLLDMSGDDSQP